MERIAIIGSDGSGKSALVRETGMILQIPVFYLDMLNWRPGWVPAPELEWDRSMEELLSRETWIIDGDYNRTIDIRLREADTIIYLDFPTYLYLFRALKRRYRYKGKRRPDMGAGCIERTDPRFLGWIWNYRRKSVPAY